ISVTRCWPISPTSRRCPQPSRPSMLWKCARCSRRAAWPGCAACKNGTRARSRAEPPQNFPITPNPFQLAYGTRAAWLPEPGPLVGVVRTVTTTLTSHTARPIIDVFPMPAHTNEMGVFEAAFGALCEALSGAVPARLLRRWRLLGAQRKARTRAWLSARLEPAADRIRPTVQPLKLGPRRHAASSTDQGYRGARPGWQQRTP